MSKVANSTIDWAHKPYDIVTDSKGNAGFIQEVSVNDCQSEPMHQISYAVEWMVGHEHKNAWFNHDELTVHGNILVKIAECSCHPAGRNRESVKRLMKYKSS